MGPARRRGVGACPSGCGIPYHLHTADHGRHLRGAGAVASTSLLGYTGQLSLGHAALLRHRRLRVRARSTVKLEWSPWLGLRRRHRRAGARRLGDRPARPQAPRRVLRAAHHQLRRRDLAGERELDGPDQRPARAFPACRRCAIALPGLPELSLRIEAARTTTWCWRPWSRCLSRLPSRSSRSRVGRALVALRENETLAESVGIDGTHYLVLAAAISAAHGRRGGRALRALHALREPGGLPVHLHGDHGHHGGRRRQGARWPGPWWAPCIFTVLPETLRALTSWQWQMLALRRAAHRRAVLHAARDRARRERSVRRAGARATDGASR